MNNNQDMLYNISLNARETEDVMNALADKANLLSALQKKIFGQAIQQKEAFDKFLKEQNAAIAQQVEEIENESKQTKNNKKKEIEG